jgi:hypothetical protein
VPQQTKQALAIAAAQAVAAYMAQLAAVHDAVNGFIATYNDNTYDIIWQQLPTTAVNADGTVGAADGTPNTAHPIAVPTNNPLLVARNDLLTAVGCLQNFQLYMTGQAVASQTNTPRKFADLLNK